MKTISKEENDNLNPAFAALEKAKEEAIKRKFYSYEQMCDNAEVSGNYRVSEVSGDAKVSGYVWEGHNLYYVGPPDYNFLLVNDPDYKN